MMLANPTAGDTEVIARLGDELCATHGARAAHCCYLLAELPPDAHTAGHDDASDGRMLLVGQDHRQPGGALDLYAVQATEIYAHFRHRVSADFPLAGRSPYALAYAHALHEAGESTKAAAYVEGMRHAATYSGGWDAAAEAELDALHARLAAAGYLAPRRHLCRARCECNGLRRGGRPSPDPSMPVDVGGAAAAPPRVGVRVCARLLVDAAALGAGSGTAGDPAASGACSGACSGARASRPGAEPPSHRRLFQ